MAREEVHRSQGVAFLLCYVRFGNILYAIGYSEPSVGFKLRSGMT
jgi:hypothetical protein